jgi:hypothetical protein
MIGTPHYLAPEVVLAEGEGGYTAKVRNIVVPSKYFPIRFVRSHLCAFFLIVI